MRVRICAFVALHAWCALALFALSPAVTCNVVYPRSTDDVKNNESLRIFDSAYWSRLRAQKHLRDRALHDAYDRVHKLSPSVSLQYVRDHEPDYSPRSPPHRKIRIDLRPRQTASNFVQCDNYEFVGKDDPSADYVVVFACTNPAALHRDVRSRAHVPRIVCLCNESPGGGHANGFWSSRENREHCDVSAGPSSDADIHTSFARWTVSEKRSAAGYAEEVVKMVRNPNIRELAPVAFVQRNCRTRSRRERFVRELAKYIRVHALGSCLHNHDYRALKPRNAARPNADTKFDMIGHYTFTIALENVDQCGYVTEKMFDALAVGTVPIVRGLPCNERYIPNTRSVIRTRDFDDDPVRLANYLHYLVYNTTEYMQYHRWRIEPAPFKKRWVHDVLYRDFTSLMCQIAASR